MKSMSRRRTEKVELPGAGTAIWRAPSRHLPHGNDPKTSVINADHRTHDVKNLFLCDGSSLVTSGRGQPTMTIEALAFRAADRITALAKRGEISA